MSTLNHPARPSSPADDPTKPQAGNAAQDPDELEAALAEAAHSEFAAILTQFEQGQHKHVQGEPLDGSVVMVTDDFVYVDIGRKMDGVIEVFKFRDAAGKVAVQRGDKLTVTVSGRGPEGHYMLSLLRVEVPKDWSALETAFAEKRIIRGTVLELVKGGLRVDVGARAFMPASRSGARDIPEMERLVGQDIECRITKLNVEEEDLVVDRRSVLEERERESRERAFQDLREGQVVRGTVRNLMDFGAFVDIGGVDGLLHVADMSWQRIAKPADMVAIGDPVEVKILKIAPDTRKISLGMKQLQPEPFTVAAGRLNTGDRIRGKVVRVTDFGAFVEIEPGVEGLIHVTEMSWAKGKKKPSEIVKTGEMVEVQVLGVNTGTRRIALGLKQALGDPWEDVATRFPLESIVEGKVTTLAKFGAFVDLGNGLEGMVHIADIPAERRLNHPREAVTEGQTVRALVLEHDHERRRLKLGMKQLIPTSADEFIAEHQVGQTMTGRVVEVNGDRARVELAEGVTATCRGVKPARGAAESSAKPESADVGSLGALLAARWKSGGANADPNAGELREGQVRSFRITGMDAKTKRIDVELA
ncbi:MAG: S1 RNA-binding domain-containing protein [Acidobacteria bacterium]|nr:S1 RNA-binding domain-containing protein [Acidobacteriota bacterium]